MRSNDPQKFTLNFRLANNYPVDLYYLMDLSYSMKDDKEKLATLGVLIANEMNNITENFRLGFGSFVDKVVMPYVSMAPNKINNPCDQCEPAYGFKNQLPLNGDPSLFQTKVQEAKVSGNLDAPEGGLDAVMQAIACESQIGWRNPSRRMLLYSTDAGFHFAGDGKLGGIIKPNDGQCHLSNGIYTESVGQDYPSISQIAAKIEEKNVNLIFAVTEKQVDIYKQLKNFIPGSVTGRLADDSSNIVALVRDNYQKITSKVEMSTTSGAEDVIIRYFSRCKKKHKCYASLTSVQYFLLIKLNDITFMNETDNKIENGNVENISNLLVQLSVSINVVMFEHYFFRFMGDISPTKSTKTGVPQVTFDCSVCNLVKLCNQVFLYKY
ncbi:integrin beta 1, partial [Mytilus galloprovincialis]